MSHSCHKIQLHIFLCIFKLKIWTVSCSLFVLCLCSDLSSQPELQNVILDCFLSSNEEVKSAASYALGLLKRFLQCVSIGSA